MMPAALTLSMLTLGLFVGGDVQGGIDLAKRLDDPVFKRPSCGMPRHSKFAGLELDLANSASEFPASRRVQIPNSSLSFRFPKDLDLQSEEEMSGEAAFDKVSTYFGESSNCIAVVTVSSGKSIDLSSDAILLACSAAIVDGLREQGFDISDYSQAQEKVDDRHSIWMKMTVEDSEMKLQLRVRLIEDEQQLAVTTILSVPDDRNSESVAQEAFESIRFWKGQ